MSKQVSRLVVGILAALSFTLVSAAPALAVPGDRAIDNPSPGEYRLDDDTLEPGCFDLGRIGPFFAGVDASSFDAEDDNLPDGELVMHNTTGGLSIDVDQVLIPSEFGGYNVVNTFDVGSGANENAPSISNGEVGVERFAPDANGNGNPDPIEGDDIIVCLSDDSALSQNEPYNQEAGGLVSAKNRPILTPHVTAVGVSALEPLNTYRIGLGYSVERWYLAPTFDGHGLVPAVTDPEAGFFGSDGIPNVVRLRARLDDLAYDSRRVNDVDKAGESWVGGDPDDGQDIYFARGGDMTAYLSNGGTSLLTTLTQGDFPYQWALRPSLASPGSLREVSYSLSDLEAWESSWQKWYDGTGPHPTMALAPGTNSPAPDDRTLVNVPERSVMVNGVPAQVTMTPAQVNNLVQKAAKAKKRFRKTCRQKAAKKFSGRKANSKKHAKYIRKCKRARNALR